MSFGIRGPPLVVRSSFFDERRAIPQQSWRDGFGLFDDLNGGQESALSDAFFETGSSTFFARELDDGAFFEFSSHFARFDCCPFGIVSLVFDGVDYFFSTLTV